MRGFLRKSIGRNGGTDEYGITLLWNSPFIRRIYLMNLLIVAAATGLFGIYLYVSTFAQAKEQLLENSRKTMREVTSDIEAAVRRMETQAAGMVLDESFRESVGGLERKSSAELYDSFRVLNDLCADAENMDGIYRIFLVFTEHHRMMDNGERIYYDDMGIADAAAGQSRFWIRSEGRIAGEYIYGVRADAGGGETVFLLFDLLERVRQQWVEQLTLSDSGGAFLGRIQDGEGDGPEAEAMKRIAEHGGATGDFAANGGRKSLRPVRAGGWDAFLCGILSAYRRDRATGGEFRQGDVLHSDPDFCAGDRGVICGFRARNPPSSAAGLPNESDLSERRKAGRRKKEG